MPNTTIYGLKDEKQEAASAVNKIRKLQLRMRRSLEWLLQNLASINIFKNGITDKSFFTYASCDNMHDV